MPKYRLCIGDKNVKKFYVPFSRDGKTYQDRVELYEIDLLTISLGREAFIEALKKSNIAPDEFSWETVFGQIEYMNNHETKYLPLLFDNDKLLTHMINMQNKYRYHKQMSEGKLIELFTDQYFSRPNDLTNLLTELDAYKNEWLSQIQQNPKLLEDSGFSKNMQRILYSWLHSTTYDEQKEFETSFLKEILSYFNFRRLKMIEYDCYTRDPIINQPNSQLIDEKDEIDPDVDAFLTEEEKRQMYG